MADVPQYRSQAASPNIGSLSIQPVQVGDLHSGEGLSQGAQQLGEALMKYAAFKKNADDTVRTNQATTGYITGLDQAETDAAQSPNYETTPQDFRKKAAELSQKGLADANLDPVDRSALELRFRTLSLAAGGRVDAVALGKQVDAATAARGQQALYLSRAAALAGSETEAKVMIEQQVATIKKNVAAGLLTADKGEAEIQSFQKSVSDQRIRYLIRTDPFAAEQTLNDPSKLPGLSGSELETFRAATEEAKDKAQKDHLLGLATGSKPEQASLAMNKALTPQHADAIYHNGIVPLTGGGPPGKPGFLSVLLKVESGGRNIANTHEGTSSGQAQGYFQITTGTWREFAGRARVDLGKYPTALSAPYSVQAQVAGIIPMGRWDPITLNALRRAGYSVSTGATLGQNIAANGDSLGAGGEDGLRRWHTNLDAFDGNIALAAAAQVSSLDKVRKYQTGIVTQYGVDATPLEIATYIGDQGDKTTHDYVLQLFGYMAVPPTGPGVSPGARYSTTTAVETEIRQQQTAAESAVKELAAMDRVTGDENLDAMKKGYAAWTPKFEKIVEHNRIAADYGSVEAATFLRNVTAYQEAKPSVEAAWQMPPQRLDNEVSRLEARAAVGATHAEMVQLGAFKAVQTEIGANYKTDPIGVGDRAGLYKVEALDPNASPTDPGFLRSLALRGAQAVQAEAVYNSLAPFRPKEVDALKQRFGEADVPEKLALLDAFRQTLGDRAYKAALDQLGLDPATATAGRFAPDDQALAKKILIGGTYKKLPGAEKTAATLTAAANEALGGNIYPPGSPALADTLTAAENVYLANRGPEALFKPPDVPAMKAAITEVVGELVDIGGRKVPAAPGMPTARMEYLWDHLSDEQLAATRPTLPRFTGVDQVVDQAGRPIAAEEITAHGNLLQKVPRGSVYYVTDPNGNRYFRQDGTALELDFRKVEYLDAHEAVTAEAARVQAARKEGIPMDTSGLPDPNATLDLFAVPPAGETQAPPADTPVKPSTESDIKPVIVPETGPDTSKTTIYKNPPILGGTGGLQ